MKTILHTYNFDTATTGGKAAWAELKARLKSGPYCYGPVLADVWSAFRHLDGQTVELETAHLFDNQWNTATLRVFDWALEAVYSGNRKSAIRRGHYLEQTAEMREIRWNTCRCSYCGKQEPAAKGYVFCPHCLDSEYLKESGLHLLRMLPVDNREDLQPLTQAESDHLLPLYREAQTRGSTEKGKARLATWRKSVAGKHMKAIDNANMEHDGLLWLADNGLAQFAQSNVIFYPHTGRFGFGWRRPLSAYEVSTVLDVISEFGFPYDIKTEDGRTLSGN